MARCLYEVRVGKEYFEMLANREEFEGVPAHDLGSVVVISISPSSAAFSLVRDLAERERSFGRSVYFQVLHRITYDSNEIEASKWFHVIPWTLGYCGETCGTVYDESSSCSICGSGRTRAGPLAIDLKNLPRSRELFANLSGELMVAARLAEELGENGFTGFTLGPVVHSPQLERFGPWLKKVPSGRLLLALRIARHSQDRSGSLDDLEEAAEHEYYELLRGLEPTSDWFELLIEGDAARLGPETQAGIDEFRQDEKGEYRCPLGHTLGLNLLGEIHVVKSSIPNTDLFRCEPRFGWRLGVKRPHAPIVASKRAWEYLVTRCVSGFRWEIVHVSLD